MIELKTRRTKPASNYFNPSGSIPEDRSQLQVYSVLTAQEFFDINSDAILSVYTSESQKEEIKKSIDSLSPDTPIKAGTTLSFPEDKVSRNLLYKFNRNVVDATSFNGFLSDRLEELLKDPDYKIRQTINGVTVLSDQVYPTVWLWSKSSSPEGGFVNISSYIQSVNLNMVKEGATFSLGIAPIDGEYQDGWKFKNINDKVVNFSIKNRKRMGTMNLISKDDIIFIKTSNLQNENSNTKVAGNVYDLIGTVDTVQYNYSPSSTVASVTIQGRDLMKLLVEDGMYFIVGQTQKNNFINDPNGLVNQRTNLDIAGNNAFRFQLSTIGEALQYIIARYSTSGMIPYEDGDESKGARVFREWGDRVSKRLVVNSDNGKFKIDELPAVGLWSIIEFFFDESINQRVLTDNGISASQGSVINAIQQICQNPFVEFIGDTFGDKYYFTVRKPLTDKKATLDFILGRASSTNGTKLTPKVRENGVNLLPIPNPNELPQDRDVSNLVITIDEANNQGENLQWDTEVYSWYQVVSQLSADSRLKVANNPPVSFNEYAKVFGVRSYSQKIMYQNQYTDIVDRTTSQTLGQFAAQTVNELRFVIESKALLPFTKKGTLNIEHNRLIKRGTYIYYKPLDMVFYVDGVNHTQTINSNNVSSSTTLTVSRGMVYGKGQILKKYFEIIDFDGINSDLQDTQGRLAKELVANWKVNKEVFNYFLQRRQNG